MNSNQIDIICEGNLEELKKIPKIKFTEKIYKNLIKIMEDKLKDINNTINSGIGNENLKYILSYNIEKKQNIENCMLYLKKII